MRVAANIHWTSDGLVGDLEGRLVGSKHVKDQNSGWALSSVKHLA